MKTTAIPWSSVPLDSVARFIRGITFKPAELVEREFDDAVACMRTKNVQTDLDERDRLFVPSHLVKRSEQYLQQGDLLVSTANSWELVGKASWVPELTYRATAGGFISILRGFREKVLPRYLYHWFTSPRVQDRVRSCGRKTTNISNLNYSLCLAIEIPLPYPDDPARSLAEQKRIADILDKADRIRRNRKELIPVLNSLIDSVFADMIGHVPSQRSVHPITALRPYLAASNGKASGRILSDEPTGIPIYGGNGVNGWATQALYEEPVVVVGRVGQQCGVTRLTKGPAWISDNAIAIRSLDPGKVDLEYLESVLRRSALGHDVRYIDLPYINQSMFLDLPLPLPPIQVQLDFVRRKKAIEKTIGVTQEMHRMADELFESLTQRAFRGEL